MILKDALRSIGRLQAMTLSLLVSNVLMAAGLSFAILALNAQHDRIVLLPPHLDQKAAVAWRSADAEYIKSFALYVATLVGSIQPRSASTIIDATSAFMVPKLYAKFREKALNITNDPIYKSTGAAMSFQPSQIRYEPETSRVFVMGTLLTVSAAGEQTTRVIYEIGVIIKEGRPWVHHFHSYESNQPQTLEWHMKKAARENTEIPEHAKPLAMRPDPLAGLSEAQQHSAAREHNSDDSAAKTGKNDQ
jgi:conjugal transfer pilus assembly protein TraE